MPGTVMGAGDKEDRPRAPSFPRSPWATERKLGAVSGGPEVLAFA